jgi:uncharacterized membrane-anchored protein
MGQMNKVAKITASFWVMKILATTLGETSGDFLSMTLNLGYIVSLAITTAFFLFTLILQLASKKYHPVFYWAVIVGTTTVGTEISDSMDRTFGLGYVKGSLILASLLLIALAVWYYKWSFFCIITPRLITSYYSGSPLSSHGLLGQPSAIY